MFGLRGLKADAEPESESKLGGSGKIKAVWEKEAASVSSSRLRGQAGVYLHPVPPHSSH